jgi:TetR/AcrR family transcriptional regulator of autoinduction and epiphytic fitness
MSRTLSPAKDEAILQAAVALLIEAGYARLTMEAVAARAAVSKRTLYKRFGDKDALIAAAATRLFAALPAALPNPPRRQRGAFATLMELCERIVDFLLEPAVLGILRVVVAESHMHPALAAAFMEHGKKSVERIVAGCLRDCPELQVRDPDLAATHLLGLVKEVAVWPQLLAPTQPPTAAARRTAIDAAVRTFLRAHVPS